MPTITVAAAVIQQDGRYLLCRRPAHKRHGGLWEFPGGKLHDGESVTDAIRRELREELHVEPTSVGPVRASIPDQGSLWVPATPCRIMQRHQPETVIVSAQLCVFRRRDSAARRRGRRCDPSSGQSVWTVERDPGRGSRR
jgi:8-oxo-dGTP pyrophosphatase MutT (NUDIX family)